MNKDKPVRFFILAAGRTGSTRLRMLLDSHPQCVCHGEVFGANLATLAKTDPGLAERLLSERSDDPVGFLKNRVHVDENSETLGFKILYQQLEEEWPGLLEAVLADRDIRVVHLIRRNGVKRFLSEYFVGTVTRKNLYMQEEELPTLNPVSIPVDVLLSNLEAIDNASERMRRLFKDHPFHEISYEDSLDDNGPVMQQLLAFLGLPPATLSVPIKKILPRNPGSLIANIEAVEKALTGTRFEPMLNGLR